MNIMLSNKDLTMSSRDIANLLDSRHSDVIRSILRLIEKSAIQGYTPTPYTLEQNGQTYYEYFLVKRDTYVIVAQLSPEFTAKLVDRWQELEQQVAAPQHHIPQSFAEALMLAANQAAELEAARPAVEFVDRYVKSTGNMGFRQVAKLLKAKENDFRAFLQDSRIMYRLGGDWVPYASHIDAGRFYVTTGTGDNDHTFTSAKFTPKGVEWVAKLWGSK